MLAIAAAAWAALALLGKRPNDTEPLVVYCAHDELYAEKVLREFERKTGIAVAVRYDTEATKSLGLVNLIVAERDNPRCDVFWNNELLGTVDLAEQELLEPYRGSGHARIPERFKDPEGRWTGFAARLRVYIVNTEAMSARESDIERLLASDDLSRIAIAKPLFGTTLTHYTVLWDAWGEDRLREWHADTRRRGIREVDGNATTKNLVAAGTCDLGFTDTDDYFVARDEGRPVEIVPVRVGERTICIPNSVAIVRGTKQPEAAQKLVDFLLSAETELALARSASRQVPLGPVEEDRLPEEVRPLAEWARDGIDLRPLLSARAATLAWLSKEYAP